MQIVSDLHLEFYRPQEIIDKVKLKITAKYLGLLGDICVCGTNDIINMERFLDYYSPRYELIFWLPGNHEFYSGKKTYRSIEDIILRCKNLCKKYDNVVFLNNNFCDIKINETKYRILGTTLWTNIPKIHEEFIAANMNDYNHIYINGERYLGLITMKGVVRLTPADVTAMHMKAVRYIYKHIKESPLPLIILTHHKPFLETVEYKSSTESKLNFGYETNIIGPIHPKLKQKIKFWGYGHTHKHFASMVDGIFLLSNPKGYPGQQTKFENDLYIKL
jgi:hypothetical protein